MNWLKTWYKRLKNSIKEFFYSDKTVVGPIMLSKTTIVGVLTGLLVSVILALIPVKMNKAVEVAFKALIINSIMSLIDKYTNIKSKKTINTMVVICASTLLVVSVMTYGLGIVVPGLLVTFVIAIASDMVKYLPEDQLI